MGLYSVSFLKKTKNQKEEKKFKIKRANKQINTYFFASSSGSFLSEQQEKTT